MLYTGFGQGVEEEGPRMYGDKAAAWVRVPESTTLGQLLARPDYVVPGIPVIFVVARGTAYRERFLGGDVPVAR